MARLRLISLALIPVLATACIKRRETPPQTVAGLPFAIEAKKPFRASEELRLSLSDGGLTVSGETFSYGFSAANGLISSIKVLDQEFLADPRVPFPDMYVSDSWNPELRSYYAREERGGGVRVVYESPERVIVAGSGRYHSPDGVAFPLSYLITYDIFIDGVVFLRIDHQAEKELWFRFLCHNRGVVPKERVEFFSRLTDASTAQWSSSYNFEAVRDGVEQFSGIFIPWFWLGDRRTGVEITTWDVTNQRFGETEYVRAEPEWAGSAIGDPKGMFRLRREGENFVWENHLVLNRQTQVPEGWRQTDYYSLAITPPRNYDPYFSIPRAPERRDPSWRSGEFIHRLPAKIEAGRKYSEEYAALVNRSTGLIDEGKTEEAEAVLREAIALEPEAAPAYYNMSFVASQKRVYDQIRQRGQTPYREINEWEQLALLCDPEINLTANVGSESDLHSRIARTHQAGLYSLPYVSFTDLWESTIPYREHGAQWAVEPWCEFEFCTAMMCPAADQWREYWKSKLEWAFNTFDFDGIYFDMWFGKMFCENPLHGCNARFRRAAYPWLRDMMVRAYNVMKSKKEHAIIRVNTNFMPIAMFNSMIDIRLVGEARNIETMGPDERFGYYFSYRLGANTQTITRGDNWSFGQWLNFGLANMSLLLPRGGGSEAEINLLSRVVDTFRFLPVDKSRFYPYLAGLSPVRSDRPEAHVNLHAADRGLLLTVMNDSPEPARIRLDIADPGPLGLNDSGSYMIYQPVPGTFLRAGPDAGGSVFPIRANLAGHDNLLLLVIPWEAERPRLLYALGADGVLSENWDAAGKALDFELAAAKPISREAEPMRLFSGSIWGNPLEVTIHCPPGRPKSIERAGAKIDFQWDRSSSLARFKADRVEKEAYRVAF